MLAYNAASASGYRYRTSGVMSSLGIQALYWGSSSAGATSQSGSNLNAYLTWLNSVSLDYRVNGFPVRCVQEEI